MRKITCQSGTGSDRGFILYMALLLLLLVGAASGLILRSARNHSLAVRRWHVSDQCLLDAQSALERVKYEIVQSYFASSSADAGSLDWFETWDINFIGNDPVYLVPEMDSVNGSMVAVTIAGVAIFSDYVEIELIGAARRPVPYDVQRMIGETLRVYVTAAGGLQPFEYAYLLNTSGQLRNNMVVNGDIRINGNYRLNPSSLVNGERFAAGRITANSPSLSVTEYWNAANFGPAARPTDPSGVNNIEWPMGFVPTRVKNTDMPHFDLPPIDVDALAAVARGRISRDGKDIVINVYDGAGPDGIPGTADDGTLVLDGRSSPITIDGAVFVKGDVIIRGKVQGQGTIYAGRNVHITGDLSYLNPPAWPKPDSNPVQTAVANAKRDLLVLASRGNIVIGNYTTATWSNRVWNIMTDPANIIPYEVTASDAEIGYDSDNDSSNGYMFDGRYYLPEANKGRRLSGVGTNTVPRRYYESSLANSTLNALSDADNVPKINSALFSNHGIIGNMGSGAPGGNTMLNGAMAARRDLTVFYGLFVLNWDIRLGSKSKELLDSHFLFGAGATGITANAATVGWREIH